jgi:four helix bundle protein
MVVSEIKTYRDLIAWQKGMELVKLIYQVTVHMPESERFGLTNQMRRAAVSIPSNIAEGYARQTTADYIKFLRMARGSMAELSTQIEIALGLGMIAPNPRLIALLEEQDRILQGLIRSLEAKLSKRKRAPSPSSH